MRKFSLISGWGRNKFVEAEVYNPLDNNDLINKVISSKKHSLISRGLGRSYGDSAHLEKKTVIQLPNSSSIEFNAFVVIKERSAFFESCKFKSILRVSGLIRGTSPLRTKSFPSFFFTSLQSTWIA